MRAAVKSGSAGEESVAVSYLTNVVTSSAHGNDGAGAALLPQVNVVLSIEGNDATTGRSGGGVNTNAVRKRLGEQSVRVGIAQVCFGEEGELVKILNAVDIVGSNSLLSIKSR